MIYTETGWKIGILVFSKFSHFLYKSCPLYKGVNYTETDWNFGYFGYFWLFLRGWIIQKVAEIFRFSASFCTIHSIQLLFWYLQKVTEYFKISASFCISHTIYMWVWIIQKLTENEIISHFLYKSCSWYVGMIYTETDWICVHFLEKCMWFLLKGTLSLLAVQVGVPTLKKISSDLAGWWIFRTIFH